jgi:plastocyanin
MRPTFRIIGTLTAATLVLAACGGGSPTVAPTTAGAASIPPAATGAPATTAPVASEGAKLCDDVTQDAPATVVEASIADFTFSGPISAKVGDVVTWTNADSAPHGVQTDDPGCKMNGSIAANAKRSLVFNQAGTFSFFCFVHPDMKGSITVS